MHRVNAEGNPTCRFRETQSESFLENAGQGQWVPEALLPPCLPQPRVTKHGTARRPLDAPRGPVLPLGRFKLLQGDLEVLVGLTLRAH